MDRDFAVHVGRVRFLLGGVGERIVVLAFGSPAVLQDLEGEVVGGGLRGLRGGVVGGRQMGTHVDAVEPLEEIKVFFNKFQKL